MLPVVKPLLERSLEKYREFRVRRLASAYCGGSIIVLTLRFDSGRLWQGVCTADELDTPEFAVWKTEFEDIKASPDGPVGHGMILYPLDLDAKLPE
jgi:hypothetical protein